MHTNAAVSFAAAVSYPAGAAVLGTLTRDPDASAQVKVQLVCHGRAHTDADRHTKKAASACAVAGGQRRLVAPATLHTACVYTYSLT